MEILYAIIAFGGALAVATSLRVLKEYERAVVFRLGRVRPIRGPGLIFLVPFAVERMERVSLRVIAMDIPPQDVITRDNVSVKVNAVLYFRVNDPLRAILEIEDYLFATSQLAQTTLRSVIGQADLDHLLAEREKFNEILREIIDQGTDPWGIEVTGVEVKDVDLPQEMKRAMARQAEAERERRAKVISAEGEFQAAIKLRDAAGLLSQEPASLQLRFLQTASEIAAENNSTTLFPMPINLFSGPLQGLFGTRSGSARAPGEEGGAADASETEAEASPRALAEGGTPELSAGAAEPFRRLDEGEGSAEEIESHLDKAEIARRARRRVAEDEPDGDGGSGT
ncbi:MAG: slipin family protein [Candidatus Palauibacterales bacterium]|nr:slipin family protein [Candidatus Palauibacterales bacterium]MDP2528982.1 slipin family protein [Candidatus Palauibacterales bacterium]MDP2583800.1 slipin family protein [Candidatus Palauibacterales bacterium]